MAIKLVQNTYTHNKRKTINNYLKNMPSKKRGHPATNFDNILFIVRKDINNIFQLQGLLEHIGFKNKLAIIKQMLNM
jgi:hypothetical protein